MIVNKPGRPANHQFWLGLPIWASWEATMLFCGLEPDIKINDFSNIYKSLYEGAYPLFSKYSQTIQRAILRGDLKNNTSILPNVSEINGEPYDFIRIALEYELDIPQEYIDFKVHKDYKKEVIFYKDSIDHHERKAIPDYLNINHSSYSMRLAVAIEAWQAINLDKSLLYKTTPKKALKKWLNENAKEKYNLTERTIEEISTIANWKKGGSPITPT